MDEKLHRAARALIVKAFDRSVLLFWLVVLVLMFLLLVAPLRSAPAPFPRTAPTLRFDRSLPGEWVMEWAGSHYDVTLSPFGAYTARVNGTVIFFGHWTACNRSRHISITEKTASSDSYKTFVGPLEGPTVDGEGLSYPGVSVRWVRK